MPKINVKKAPIYTVTPVNIKPQSLTVISQPFLHGFYATKMSRNTVKDLLMTYNIYLYVA